MQHKGGMYEQDAAKSTHHARRTSGPHQDAVVLTDGRRKWGKERSVECVGGGVRLKTDVEVAWQGLFLFIGRLLSRVTVLSSLPSTKVMPLPAVHMTQWMSRSGLSPRRSSVFISAALHSIATSKTNMWVNQRRISVIPPLFATYSEAATAFLKWHTW